MLKKMEEVEKGIEAELKVRYQRFTTGYQVTLELFKKIGFSEKLFKPGLSYIVNEDNFPRDAYYSDPEYTNPVLNKEIDCVPDEHRIINFTGSRKGHFADQEPQVIAHDIFYGGGISKDVRNEIFDFYDEMLIKYHNPSEPGHSLVHLSLGCGTPPLEEDGRLNKKEGIRFATQFFSMVSHHMLGGYIGGDSATPPEVKTFFNDLGVPYLRDK